MIDRGLLGEDRDALLALEVARVHDPIDDGLVGAEGARLAQHRVDEGRLAVVDVGDDRHVAQVGADGGGGGGVRFAPVFVVEASGTGDAVLQVGWDGRLSHGCRESAGAQVLPRTLLA